MKLVEMELYYMKKYDDFHKHLQIMNITYLVYLNNEFIISGVIYKLFIHFEKYFIIEKN